MWSYTRGGTLIREVDEISDRIGVTDVTVDRVSRLMSFYM